MRWVPSRWALGSSRDPSPIDRVHRGASSQELEMRCVRQNNLRQVMNVSKRSTEGRIPSQSKVRPKDRSVRQGQS